MPRKLRTAPREIPGEIEKHPPCRSPFATVEVAAWYLHVSTRTIRDLKHVGILKLVPHPGKKPDAKPWRFLYADLDCHIEEVRK
jgi:hypothetical protein